MITAPLDSTRLTPIYAGDHIQGAECAPYTLVEYGDYQCCDCARVFELIRHLQITLAERLRVIYRHYPLSGIHPEALGAAEAAEAAGAQGRFWEMHSLLFRNQNALKRKNLLAYGEALGLDIDQLRNDLNKRAYQGRVREDFRSGVQNGIFEPPGILLNDPPPSQVCESEPSSEIATSIPELAQLRVWFAPTSRHWGSTGQEQFVRRYRRLAQTP
jgi:protein-disulfide isomerase